MPKYNCQIEAIIGMVLDPPRRFTLVTETTLVTREQIEMNHTEQTRTAKETYSNQFANLQATTAFIEWNADAWTWYLYYYDDPSAVELDRNMTGANSLPLNISRPPTEQKQLSSIHPVEEYQPLPYPRRSSLEYSSELVGSPERHKRSDSKYQARQKSPPKKMEKITRSGKRLLRKVGENQKPKRSPSRGQAAIKYQKQLKIANSKVKTSKNRLRIMEGQGASKSIIAAQEELVVRFQTMLDKLKSRGSCLNPEEATILYATTNVDKKLSRKPSTTGSQPTHQEFNHDVFLNYVELNHESSFDLAAGKGTAFIRELNSHFPGVKIVLEKSPHDTQKLKPRIFVHQRDNKVKSSTVWMLLQGIRAWDLELCSLSSTSVRLPSLLEFYANSPMLFHTQDDALQQYQQREAPADFTRQQPQVEISSASNSQNSSATFMLPSQPNTHICEDPSIEADDPWESIFTQLSLSYEPLEALSAKRKASPDGYYEKPETNEEFQEQKRRKIGGIEERGVDEGAKKVVKKGE